MVAYDPATMVIESYELNEKKVSKAITPFVGAQVDICEAFEFGIPDGCAPVYTSRRKPVRKRSRPPKKLVERDS